MHLSFTSMASFNYLEIHLCCNPSFGLTTKAKACKGAGQKGSLGVTFHAPRCVGKCEGMNTHIPKRVPIWELEFRWILESSKSDCKGQNPLISGVHYIIGKFLKHKCRKWACMTHLDTLNTNYGQKKGQESPQFLCVQVACDIPFESSRQGLQLCFRLHLNWRSTNNIMGPQSCRSPNFGNFGTPTWESHDKMPFGC
jgi:hypothetical protein